MNPTQQLTFLESGNLDFSLHFRFLVHVAPNFTAFESNLDISAFCSPSLGEGGEGEVVGPNFSQPWSS